MSLRNIRAQKVESQLFAPLPLQMVQSGSPLECPKAQTYEKSMMFFKNDNIFGVVIRIFSRQHTKRGKYFCKKTMSLPTKFVLMLILYFEKIEN